MERIASMTPVYRLSPLTTPPVEKSPIMNLTLQEILIIGNCNDQVMFKWTSNTTDMFTTLIVSVIKVGSNFQAKH
jgi:hypothetical protein